MAFHVDSEVGQLRQVIVHRPGLELSRLTPSNVEELLFDDVLWAQRAREEHDAFVRKLWTMPPNFTPCIAPSSASWNKSGSERMHG